ncbi:MAG: hypothetical protein RQ866_00995 [Bacteroidales bacterium]|nr:hypothetical protein [Bacteroidales bacterium]
MKALVKWIWFIFVLFLIALGCNKKGKNQKETVIIKKVLIEDNFFAMERPWGISDGIKILSTDKSEYFVFYIESPPGVIRNKADVNFVYRLVSQDSIMHEKRLTYSLDTLYPFYNLNSLKVFKSNNQYGAYFYTTLMGYPYGIDPNQLVMWIYYNENLYKFSGIIPMHPDWSWENTYSFTPDEKLKREAPEAYQQLIDIWNQDMPKYKKYYHGY